MRRRERWARNLNLANQLTFLRLVSVPFLAVAVQQGRFRLAASVYVIAALTDLVDGWLARRFDLKTAIGAYLDPAADKLMATVAFIALTDFSGHASVDGFIRFPAWVTILVISRDVLIVGVSLLLYVTLGRTQFQPSVWGKWATAVTMVTVGAILAANGWDWRGLWVDALIGLTLGLTAISGFHYLGRTIRELDRAAREHGGPGNGRRDGRAGG